MAALRSAVFFVLFYGATVPWVVVAFVAMIFSERALQLVVRSWAWYHRVCTRWIVGIRTRIEGTIPEGQYLFAAKHQAMFETIDLQYLLESPIPVLKKELTDIPGWGWLARRYGGVAVDRSGGAKALRAMLKRINSLMTTGRSVIIFPEGTRVAVGETPSLQAGFSGLYKMFGLPVVPVAIDSGHAWRRDSWIKRSGIITFRFFEPIPPGLPREEIEARVHGQINTLERVRDDLA